MVVLASKHRISDRGRNELQTENRLKRRIWIFKCLHQIWNSRNATSNFKLYIYNILLLEMFFLARKAEFIVFEKFNYSLFGEKNQPSRISKPENMQRWKLCFCLNKAHGFITLFVLFCSMEWSLNYCQVLLN